MKHVVEWDEKGRPMAGDYFEYLLDELVADRELLREYLLAVEELHEQDIAAYRQSELSARQQLAIRGAEVVTSIR